MRFGSGFFPGFIPGGRWGVFVRAWWGLTVADAAVAPFVHDAQSHASSRQAAPRPLVAGRRRRYACSLDVNARPGKAHRPTSFAAPYQFSCPARDRGCVNHVALLGGVWARKLLMSSVNYVVNSHTLASKIGGVPEILTLIDEGFGVRASRGSANWIVFLSASLITIP